MQIANAGKWVDMNALLVLVVGYTKHIHVTYSVSNILEEHLFRNKKKKNAHSSYSYCD